MKRDEVILVDEQDRMTGSDSKHKAHTFNSEQPRGLLHRAFSVFLFDDDNQLLLQRRANSKITFPGVWTNTCCSHQLHGYEPSEIDSDTEVSSGSVPGAKVTIAHHFIMTSSLVQVFIQLSNGEMSLTDRQSWVLHQMSSCAPAACSGAEAGA